ncbi:hypothetical protein BN1195_03634 [Chryseobacterium oranimense G311]|uniref:hypothetical protein n=1 Tax=Chryseobacterium oranimense TaxID=421058 RepID=UPI000533BA74|nr:hypothetical protein [Chryseobacterium oranimense]CEJ71289.1 hypothetical protein BN1195_03634 [Chryseobacterium oranimense G311]DAG72847.1 MAG TPA: hypothetical protein [Caudoviricetes sp.]
MNELENELSNLILKYKSPDVNTCEHSSFYERTSDSFLGDDVLFYYIKFEDLTNGRFWTLSRIYKSISNYTDEKYNRILELRIKDLKNIFENPNSAQYKLG